MTTSIQITEMVTEACKSIKYNIDAMNVQRWIGKEYGEHLDWHKTANSLEFLYRQHVLYYDGMTDSGHQVYKLH